MDYKKSHNQLKSTANQADYFKWWMQGGLEKRHADSFALPLLSLYLWQVWTLWTRAEMPKEQILA